jgi:2-haloacid dehalogenase
MPTTVIFDFGGVLIDWNPRHLYRKLIDDEEEMEHFLATVCTPSWNEQQDGGRPLSEATALLADRFPQQIDLITAYYDRWTEMVKGPMEPSIAVLAELHERGVPLYGLTTWSAETYPYVEGRYDFMDWFDGIVVSGRERMKKPDEDIFRLLLDRYDLDASDTVFIDDNLANIATARRLGIHGIPFTTPEQLRRDLAGYGLL